MFDDDEPDYLGLFLNKPEGPESMYTSQELCQYVFEVLEMKHPVKITEIEYSFGGFEFSISADLTKQMTLPNCWNLRSFGDGKLNFFLSLEDFQMLYNKLEERDFKEAARAAIERMYGKVCDLVSVKEPKEPMFEGSIEFIVRVKDGCRFKTWLPIQWVEGNQVAFQIDYDAYYDLTHSDEYRNFIH